MNRRSDIRCSFWSPSFAYFADCAGNEVLRTLLLTMVILLTVAASQLKAQEPPSKAEIEEVMMKATRYMVEEVSTNGGYVDRYLTDFSRRFGELEAFDTQITIRAYGRSSTPDMGQLFLNAYEATGDEYYYQAAKKVAEALIWGQDESGGWDYIIDFAGSRSLKKWYETIGGNAWGWPEYNNYYGTATHKQVTTPAARFLLRMYLEKLDPAFKPALDRAVNFFVESQYPLGGWPQRYPIRHDHHYQGKPGYTHFNTFSNVGVIYENIEFLVFCYLTLGDEELLDPIRRGMNFYLITQQGNPFGGWGVTYDLDLSLTYARPYEPAALSPNQTYNHGLILMRFYKYTGDRKFLARIPDALDWLEQSRLPEEENEGGQYTHASFIEMGANRALYSHREGENVRNGRYWVDYNDEDVITHFGQKTDMDERIERLERLYREVSALSLEEATAHSPLQVTRFEPGRDGQLPQQEIDLTRAYYQGIDELVPDFQKGVYSFLAETPDRSDVRQVLDNLDEEGRWITTGEVIFPEYSEDAVGEQANTGLTTTAPSDMEFISTRHYVEQMTKLINYLKTLP